MAETEAETWMLQQFNTAWSQDVATIEVLPAGLFESSITRRSPIMNVSITNKPILIPSRFDK